MIEAGEVLVAKRSDDRFGERDRARLYGVAVGVFPLDENLTEHVEVVFEEPIF